MSKQVKTKEVPKINEDEQYLADSIVQLQNQLAAFRYNIKEIKACMLVAENAKNENRMKILQEQKSKSNELIKSGLEDQKRVYSLYKKIKKVNLK